ncbi:MAG: histidine kinase [Nostoc sp.]|uniref:histidine kinase n=1 Tax=Nostoc sp. TaxID=1180 RepID=UPI002FF9A86E
MRGMRGVRENEGEELVTNAQCPMPNAQCPMPNAQCPMPNAQCPLKHQSKYYDT